MPKFTGFSDYNGKPIYVGDTLSDSVPSNGIVKEFDGLYYVTSDYNGRDINNLDLDDTDELTEDLILDNKMIVKE